MNKQSVGGSESEQNQVDANFSMAAAIAACARQLGKPLDRLRLHQAIEQYRDELLFALNENTSDALLSVAKNVSLAAGIHDVEALASLDPARLPCVVYVPKHGFGVVMGMTPSQEWIVNIADVMLKLPGGEGIQSIRFVYPAHLETQIDRPVFDLFKKLFFSKKDLLVEACIASVIINLLALFTSIYSMQVYDRVIPTQGYSTLFVLTLAVTLAMGFDFLLKMARSHLMKHLATEVDKPLSRTMFGRLLQIRLDVLPSSVGSLSAQIRGYETIRSFLSASTFYFLVDLPFALVFIAIIAVIGIPQIAIIPFLVLIVSLIVGKVLKSKIDSHAAKGMTSANQKTGLLVEAIEGAETIKSGGSSWHVLSKWIDANSDAMFHDNQLKHVSELSSHISALMQQVSYVGLIAAGAFAAAEGHMTMGALIACSILSGRALSPLAQIPNIMVQAGHSLAALQVLEKFYLLETDNFGVDRPLIPSKLKGEYHLERVRFSYAGSPKGLLVNNLIIRSGEKVGVIGPVGSGKSTLVRLLSGMYMPKEGRILMDGLDISQISRESLACHIGYVQQDQRLFSGTLRENLIAGIPDPGDDTVRLMAEKTGLLNAVSSHPQGLNLPITEGGKGLSGGQRQQLAFTKLLLKKPDIWLLDEPTASMDAATEDACLKALHEQVTKDNTMVLVTHKPSMLALVQRVILVVNNQIIMDGPRDEVLSRLSAGGQKSSQVAGQS